MKRRETRDDGYRCRLGQVRACVRQAQDQLPSSASDLSVASRHVTVRHGARHVQIQCGSRTHKSLKRRSCNGRRLRGRNAKPIAPRILPPLPFGRHPPRLPPVPAWFLLTAFSCLACSNLGQILSRTVAYYDADIFLEIFLTYFSLEKVLCTLSSDPTQIPKEHFRSTRDRYIICNCVFV